jgi:hypothetical protein
LAIATEALKDFAYDSAKVSMVPDGNALLLRLELDGKPLNRLPFRYKKELGFFVRDESELGGSVFQGIKLDVNFRLPIHQLLQYGKGIQKALGGGSNKR